MQMELNERKEEMDGSSMENVTEENSLGTKENQPDQEKNSKRPEQSHEFFANTKCQYYPCHEGMEVMNCMFCYCPMYRLEHCPGKPEYFEKDGKRIKVCTNCTFPHQPENYSVVLEVLKKQMFS